jgi:adenylyltransferase/sulfurtransferase
MPEVTLEGQKRLRAAKVLCIGTGALGSPIAMYLAAAGVGTLGLVDFDTVDFTNLQRQIAHRTEWVGKPKLDSAASTVSGINPGVKIIKHNTMITSANALEIIKDYDLVVDGTDNFPTRYLVNDACVLLGKPNVYGSIFRFDGQASVFYAKDGPCYRCLYPEPPPPGLVPSCAEGGVFGVLPGVIGSIQAVETIKILISAGTPLIGRLLTFNAMELSFRTLKLRKDPECPICGKHPTITELIDYNEFCGVGRGNQAAIISATQEITPTELKEKLDRGDEFELIDVREPYEYAIVRIPGSKLIPVATVSRRLDDFDRNKEIVIMCKSGVRSAQVQQVMIDAGFKNTKNLAGGILRWAEDVDTSAPQY